MDTSQILPKQHTLRVAKYMQNLTSALIRLYPCYIKDYLRFEEVNSNLCALLSGFAEME